MGTVTARSFDLHRTERRATEITAITAIAIIRAAILAGYLARDAARAAHRLTHRERTAP